MTKRDDNTLLFMLASFVALCFVFSATQDISKIASSAPYVALPLTPPMKLPVHGPTPLPFSIEPVRPTMQTAPRCQHPHGYAPPATKDPTAVFVQNWEPCDVFYDEGQPI